MSVKIVFHCSDSTFGNAALIAKWHVLPKPRGRGWTGIGYHYVILNGWLAKSFYNDNFDGHTETGRPFNDNPFISKSEIGAHVLGYNTNSVGICLIGKSGAFTDRQLNKLLELIYLLEKQFGSIELFQHSDLDKKKPYCAGLDMEKLKQDYKIYKRNTSMD
jgi:hypothetical protein